MDPETHKKYTHQLAVQLQVVLTAWHELYPEHSDEDACELSMKLVLENLDPIVLSREAEPATANRPESGEASSANAEGPKDPRGLPSGTFKDHIIEVAIAHPDGFDIGTVIETAQAKGWRHPDPRPYVSLQVAQLARLGILERIGRGVYIPAVNRS